MAEKCRSSYEACEHIVCSKFNRDSGGSNILVHGRLKMRYFKLTSPALGSKTTFFDLGLEARQKKIFSGDM
jgi:hypothetical protein